MQNLEIAIAQRVRWWLAGLAALGLVLLLTGVAAAELQRFESVGAVPIALDAPESVAPRDAAVDRAILEAVERVASQLLAAEADRQRLLKSALPLEPERVEDAPDGDAETRAEDSPIEAARPNFEAILGRKVALYASRYRVLEDRGEGPAIFSSAPGVTTEYVVVVEVFVDTARVRRQLQKSGLLPAGGETGIAATRIRLEVEGLDAYPGYLALRELLEQELGAISVIPVELERGRAVFEVESPYESQILLEKLLAEMQPEFEIVPLVPKDSDIRLAVQWTPLLPEVQEQGLPLTSGDGDFWSPDSPDSDDSEARGASQSQP